MVDTIICKNYFIVFQDGAKYLFKSVKALLRSRILAQNALFIKCYLVAEPLARGHGLIHIHTLIPHNWVDFPK